MLRKFRRSMDIIAFNTVAYSALSIFAFICLIPFLLIIAGSFTSERSILEEGFRLIPRQFSLEAYKVVFRVPETVLRGYGISILVTVTGTVANLFFNSMTAYVLMRKQFKYRNSFAFYFFFTSLFSGGLVPWYILMVSYLGMKNNILSLIIPSIFSLFGIIIIRTFMAAIPDSISESAKIDGAGEFRIFTKLILPLSKPVLATIGLFTALGYWNDWFHAMLFIDNAKLFPLQYLLYKMISYVTMLRNMTDKVPELATALAPDESMKMAMTVITIGPVLFLYPFLQKYFMKGIMIGAIKG